MPPDCDQLYTTLLQEIKLGATRFQLPRRLEELDNRIGTYTRHCGPEQGDLLATTLRYSFGVMTVQEAITRVQRLLGSQQLKDKYRVKALSLLAKLHLPSEEYEANCRSRSEALELARANGLAVDEVLVLNNWLFAALMKNRLADAKILVKQVEEVLSDLPSELSEHPEIVEAEGRFLTHRAKVLLREAAEVDSARRQATLVAEAVQLYRSAVMQDRAVDHRRVNEQIEAAQQLLESRRSIGLPELNVPKGFLDDAHRSLDAHNCDLCRGYYHETLAQYELQDGEARHPLDLNSARTSWQRAISQAQAALSYYERIGYEGVADLRLTLNTAKEKIEMADLPRKVFLSHSGADKSLVRDFKSSLEFLRYEPWLDEDAMAAGVELERALLSGFEESCAAAFFITPNFKDEGYLSTEIDYALGEYRKKGDRFAIVTLVFGDDEGRFGEVPKLLRRFVWKEPKSHLEALRELLRALPLTPANPEWR